MVASISGIQSSDGSLRIKGGGDTVDLSVVTGSGGVQIGGDIGGTNSDPVVIGIQTIPVSATTPTAGEALILTGGVWTPTAIPLGISPGTGIGVAASSGIYTISNTGVLSFNTRTGVVTLTAADVESTFNAKGDIFVGTGSGTGAILPIGTTGQVPTVSGGTLVYATPASAVTSVSAEDSSVVVTPTTGAVTVSRGALTGDVTASAGSTATTVAKLQGITLTAPSPSSGQALVYNGSAWVPTTVVSGVSSVTAGAGGSLTISPTTGAVVASRAALTGDVTASADSNTTAIKSSVNLSGSPTTTTQSALDNSTKIATTAYADGAVATAQALDLKIANNLSDVADQGTSRYNLNSSALSAVAAVAVANVNIASPGATLDGYTILTNDEILLTAQSTGSQNGVWLWNGASSALTRPNEFPSGGTIKRGRTVPVVNGTVYADTEWILNSTAAGITIDTTAQTWVLLKNPLYAPLASPALTGTPTSPTAAAGDNTTQIATDAFVTTAVANAIAGVNPAIAVKVATTAAGDTSGLTYANGVGGIGATLTGSINTPITIDGVLLNTLGNRLLVKNDTQSPSGAFNGIYSLTVISSAGTAPVFTRALDYDQSTDINNTGAIPVQSGTANAGTSWLLTSLVTTVGTDPLTYVQFNYTPAQVVTAANIEKTFTADNQVYAGTGSGTGELINQLSLMEEQFSAKGDILVGTGSATGKLLATGTHGQELRINGSDASGYAWNAPMLGWNYIESGCVWTADAAGSTRAASMTSGVVWIAGVRLTVAAVTSRSFTASKDTYVDFQDNNDGTAAITYTEVANNTASPALGNSGTTANTIRNGIVITGASFIASGNNSNPLNATLNAINQGDIWATLPIASSIPYSVSDSLGNLIYPTSASGQLLSCRQIVSNFSTSSNAGTIVDVTGLSVTFIVPSGPSRKVRVTFWNAAMSGSASTGSGQTIAYIRNGSTTLTECAAIPPAGAGNQVCVIPVFICQLAAGTYTLKASISQGQGGASTLTLVAATTIPAFISAELL